jgi:hypothetical protein
MKNENPKPVYNIFLLYEKINAKPTATTRAIIKGDKMLKLIKKLVEGVAAEVLFTLM